MNELDDLNHIKERLTLVVRDYLVENALEIGEEIATLLLSDLENNRAVQKDDHEDNQDSC